MNKQLVSLSMAVLLSSVAYGATPSTPVEKTDKMEQTVYGGVQEGAIIDRLGQMDLTIYGTEKGGSLNSTVDRLYKEIEINGSQPTLKTEVELIEWTYEGAVKQGSLIERMNTLERSINGRVSTDALEKRISALKKVVIGSDKPVILSPATIAKTHVFKITMDDAVSTKTAKEGDTYNFTVAEDVMDGHLLVVPEGTKGKAYVTAVKKARSFGRSGELSLAFNDISTLGGDAFSAEQGAEAQAKTKTELGAAGASVAGAALLGPVGLVGGFFVKGKSIEYPVGQAFYIQPTTDVTTAGAAFDGEPQSAPAVTITSTPTVDPSTTDVGTNAAATVDKSASTATAASDKVDAAKAATSTVTSTSTNTATSNTSSNDAPQQAVVVIKKSE